MSVWLALFYVNRTYEPTSRLAAYLKLIFNDRSCTNLVGVPLACAITTLVVIPAKAGIRGVGEG